MLGPLADTSPSGPMRIVVPGTGWPTLPTRRACGKLKVTAMHSVIPYASNTVMPAPRKK